MIDKLREGNAYLELAILRFKEAGFSVKSLLDYQKNIKQHIDLESKYAPLKKMEELFNIQEKELIENNEVKRLINKLDDNQKIVLEYILDFWVSNMNGTICVYMLYNFLDDYFDDVLPTKIDDTFGDLEIQQKNTLLLTLIKIEELDAKYEVLKMLRGEV